MSYKYMTCPEAKFLFPFLGLFGALGFGLGLGLGLVNKSGFASNFQQMLSQNRTSF